MTSVRQVVISAFAEDLINAVAREQADLAAARTAAVEQRLQRVLEALAAERVGTQHFASLTGYGHGDQGREVVDRVFARVLGAEAAAVLAAARSACSRATALIRSSANALITTYPTDVMPS